MTDRVVEVVSLPAILRNISANFFRPSVFRSLRTQNLRHELPVVYLIFLISASLYPLVDNLRSLSYLSSAEHACWLYQIMASVNNYVLG